MESSLPRMNLLLGWITFPEATKALLKGTKQVQEKKKNVSRQNLKGQLHENFNDFFYRECNICKVPIFQYDMRIIERTAKKIK